MENPWEVRNLCCLEERKFVYNVASALAKRIKSAAVQENLGVSYGIDDLVLHECDGPATRIGRYDSVWELEIHIN